MNNISTILTAKTNATGWLRFLTEQICFLSFVSKCLWSLALWSGLKSRASVSCALLFQWTLIATEPLIKDHPHKRHLCANIHVHVKRHLCQQNHFEDLEARDSLSKNFTNVCKLILNATRYPTQSMNPLGSEYLSTILLGPEWCHYTPPLGSDNTWCHQDLYPGTTRVWQHVMPLRSVPWYH